MEAYNLNFEYFVNIISEVSLLFTSNYEQSILFFSMLVVLIAIYSLSRKILKLENIQFNDIDDITSYSRLIDEELGALKNQQDEFNKNIHTSEVKAESAYETNNEGKLFNNAPYSQAVQLARRGYAREDIISLCSLTESEAELILALHSNTKAA